MYYRPLLARWVTILVGSTHPSSVQKYLNYTSKFYEGLSDVAASAKVPRYFSREKKSRDFSFGTMPNKTTKFLIAHIKERPGGGKELSLSRS